jgi:hypothetical protein
MARAYGDFVERRKRGVFGAGWEARVGVRGVCSWICGWLWKACGHGGSRRFVLASFGRHHDVGCNRVHHTLRKATVRCIRGQRHCTHLHLAVVQRTPCSAARPTRAAEQPRVHRALERSLLVLEQLAPEVLAARERAARGVAAEEIGVKARRRVRPAHERAEHGCEVRELHADRRRVERVRRREHCRHERERCVVGVDIVVRRVGVGLAVVRKRLVRVECAELQASP